MSNEELLEAIKVAADMGAEKVVALLQDVAAGRTEALAAGLQEAHATFVMISTLVDECQASAGTE